VAARDEATASTSRPEVERYQRYRSGCAAYFRSAHIDVVPLSLRAGA
jgi:cyclopropane fatty-acyl-phospholipid synthase-like methyltransferase